MSDSVAKGQQGGKGAPGSKRQAFGTATVQAGGGAKFEGSCNELKGFVLDCGQPRHADV